MPRTIKSVVECHKIASERRASGLPVWDRKINIKEILYIDQSNTSEEHAAFVANAIAKRIKAKVPGKWLDICSVDYDSDLDEIVDGMSNLTATSYADDPTYSSLEDLNNMLDGLYDWADRNRVWLGP